MSETGSPVETAKDASTKKVFVNSAGFDQPLVDKICARLKELGHEVETETTLNVGNTVSSVVKYPPGCKDEAYVIVGIMQHYGSEPVAIELPGYKKFIVLIVGRFDEAEESLRKLRSMVENLEESARQYPQTKQEAGTEAMQSLSSLLARFMHQEAAAWQAACDAILSAGRATDAVSHGSDEAAKLKAGEYSDRSQGLVSRIRATAAVRDLTTGRLVELMKKT